MLRVNYVWGVALPAGTHKVEFRYRSSTLMVSCRDRALCPVCGWPDCSDGIRRRKLVPGKE